MHCSGMTKVIIKFTDREHFSLHKPSYTKIIILVYFMNDITALRQLKRATIEIRAAAAAAPTPLRGGGCGRGCAPFHAKRGSFQCTNIFMNKKLMIISYNFKAKSMHSNYLKLYVISSV